MFPNLAVTSMVSSPSATSSCRTVSVKVPVPLLWPAGMVMLKSGTAT